MAIFLVVTPTGCWVRFLEQQSLSRIRQFDNSIFRFARCHYLRSVRQASAWRPFLVVPPNSIGLSKFKSLLGLLARLGQLFLLFRKAIEEPIYSPSQPPHFQSTKNLPSGPHRDHVGRIILLRFVLCDTLSLTYYPSKIVPNPIFCQYVIILNKTLTNQVELLPLVKTKSVLRTSYFLVYLTENHVIA